jgi:hypothetical protein
VIHLSTSLFASATIALSILCVKQVAQADDERLGKKPSVRSAQSH